MIAVTETLVELCIGRHGHPVGRRDQIVARIVIERRPMPQNKRLALHPIHPRESIAGEGKTGPASLQLHVAKPLPDGNLRHFVCIDPEPPVQPSFTGRIVRFLRLLRGLPEIKKPRGGVFENEAPKFSE